MKPNANRRRRQIRRIRKTEIVGVHRLGHVLDTRRVDRGPVQFRQNGKKLFARFCIVYDINGFQFDRDDENQSTLSVMLVVLFLPPPTLPSRNGSILL